MRKVCLSGCFKRKMSKAKENFWNTIIAIFFGLIFVIAFILIMAGTGYIIGLFFEDINKNDWMVVGIGFYIVLALFWWMLFLIWQMYKKVTSDTFKFIKERYENDFDTCSIFEYCDEPGEKNDTIDH